MAVLNYSGTTDAVSADVGAGEVRTFGAFDGFLTQSPTQMTAENGYKILPLVTNGDVIPATTGAFNTSTAGDYAPTGTFDGIGAVKLDESTVRLFVNSEFSSEEGNAYTLNSGTADEFETTGARIHYFDVETTTKAVMDAGIAYDQVYGIDGEIVTSSDGFPNSGDNEGTGLDRFCSGQFVKAGTYGFVDDVYLTGEETSDGVQFALDIEDGDLWAAPLLGRMSWENTSPVETEHDDRVALVCMDDSEGAPAYLWVGEKDTSDSASFFERNGLAEGKLYAWVPDAGDVDGLGFESESGVTGNVDPRDFEGMMETRRGSWAELTTRDESKAGEEGYDDNGFALQDTLKQEAFDKGAMAFSRPEDVATNPFNGQEFAFNSTGREDFAGGADTAGDTIVADVNFTDLSNIRSTMTIVHDGDDDPSKQIRSPDNLDWAKDGYLYVQEDRAAGGLWNVIDDDPTSATFGEVVFEAANPNESSILRLDPETGAVVRVAEMNRDAVPYDQTDTDPLDVGDWESSGVVDVSDVFGATPGSLFAFDVQAHSVAGGPIDALGLAEGGQLALLAKDGVAISPAVDKAVFAAGGFDDVRGSAAADRLVGDDAANHLRGGNGDDTLSGEAGQDKLTGGRGADTFFLDDADDFDIITDFDAAAGDNLQLGGTLDLDPIYFRLNDAGGKLQVQADVDDGTNGNFVVVANLWGQGGSDLTPDDLGIA